MKVFRMVVIACVLCLFLVSTALSATLFFGSVVFPFVFHRTVAVYPYYQPFYMYNYVGNYIASEAVYGPYYTAVGFPTVWTADGTSLRSLNPVWTGDGRNIVGLGPVWTGDGKNVLGLASVWTGDGKNVVLSPLWTGDGKNVVGLTTVWTGDGKQLSPLPWTEGFFK